MKERLRIILPITLVVIFGLLYMIKRVRPKAMIVCAAFTLPIMWSTGTGAEVSKRIAKTATAALLAVSPVSAGNLN